MSNLFSYENPIMQLLMKLGDLMILNFIYLGCCLPIFTIGAAQAGLYTAMKVMQDPEDDTSLISAFFRGFSNGFGKVTIAWGVAALGTVLICLAGWVAAYNGLNVWICIIPIVICAWFTALIPCIHSRIGCTTWQLIRNCWFFIIAHPLRTLGVAVLIWVPVVVFLVGNVYTFMVLTPIWTTLYYSTAASFAYGFMKKPFKTIIDNFNKNQEEAENALPEAAEDAYEPDELDDVEETAEAETEEETEAEAEEAVEEVQV